MKLKNQCVSLGLAKKLKKLGIKQESIFFYAKSFEKKFRLYPLFVDPQESEEAKLPKKEKEYSAFTVSELGEMLPSSCESYRYEEEGYSCWICRWFVEGDISKYKHLEEADTEADARAKMLIYLLENNLNTWNV